MNTREQYDTGHIPVEQDPLLLQAAQWMYHAHPEGVYQENADEPGYWRKHADMSLRDPMNLAWHDIIRVFEENRCVPGNSPYADKRQREPFKMQAEEKVLFNKVLVPFRHTPNITDPLEEILLLGHYRQHVKAQQPNSPLIERLTDELASRVDIVTTRINAHSRNESGPAIMRDNVVAFPGAGPAPTKGAVRQ